MPDTYQEYNKSLSLFATPGPDNRLAPDTAHFDPYFPTCPIDDLQNELADDSLDINHDLNHSSQIDHSEIALCDDNPNGDSTSTVDLPALIISSSTDSCDDQELDSPHAERPNNKVRFRSRVRITSGLNRHRHKISQQQPQNRSEIDYLSVSPASSISGSRSSSISVPLRTHTDEQVGKPGWGTLGQRVSLFARGNMERRRIREQKERPGLGASSFRNEIHQRGGRGAPLDVNEETPLLLNLPSNASDHRPTREDEASQMSREIERVFGSWPGRLANYKVGFILSLHSIHQPDLLYAVVVVAAGTHSLLSLSG